MEDLQNFLAEQTVLIQQLTQQLVKKESSEDKMESLLDKLARNITEFTYDPENDLVFETWYARYEDLFLVDGKSLDDAARVRLLLRKISTSAHSRYVNYILPQHPRDISFENTVKMLTNIFGKKTSLFYTRSKCLQLVKSGTDDFIAYAGHVNRACEQFKLKDLTEDQFKCLIFVSGLHSSQYNDIRTKILSKLETDVAITLNSITEQCQQLANIKHDTNMIEAKDASSINAIKNSSHKHTERTNSSADSSSVPRTPCWFCGGLHFKRDCTYSNHKCAKCNKIGHKDGYCKAPSSSSSSSSSTTTTKNSGQREKSKRSSETQNRNKNRSSNAHSISIVNKVETPGKRKFISVYINNIPVELQFDTACDITIISKALWHEIGSPTLDNTTHIAKSASGQSISLLGEFKCSIAIQNRSAHGTCVVSKMDLNLFGINWMDKLQLWDLSINTICNHIEIVKVKAVQQHQSSVEWIKSLQNSFPTVFTSNLGKCNKVLAHLTLKADAKPIYRPKRPAPYAVMTDIENELSRLVDTGIISPVDFSPWAAPIVAVRKANGTLRICGDFSTGLNDALEPHQYPLPLPEAIFATLSAGKIFSQLDFADAYLQISVDERSRQLLTINTHRGLFEYNALPFGIKSAPGIFQQTMDQMLAGINGAVAYLDDIIITGKDEAEHRSNLFAALERIKEYGFTLNINKCHFSLPQIKYLGAIIDAHGRRPDPAKIDAINRMPPPTDIATLRSFLGGLSYYGAYIKNMRELRSPLDELLKKGTAWHWSKDCQKSFENAKKILRSDLLLTHFNPSLPIIVAADASMYGIGAVILHRFPDGTQKAISHASRSLTKAEKSYSQIEKEALGIIFAVQKFHRMIYGRTFILQTDHKPLVSIFGAKKGIPVCTANRIQRWALKLLSYTFRIEYISTHQFGHADMLSRLINNQAGPDEEHIVASITLEDDVRAVLNINLSALPVTYEMVQAATAKDDHIQAVIKYMDSQWPRKIEDPFIKQFYLRREALSVVQNCLFYGERLVVPEEFHQRILRQLHKHHPGMERMKALGRSYVYWPYFDRDVKETVRQCEKCSLAAKSPTKTTLSSWPKPQRPWQRVHMDYAGPVNDWYYLVVVDAYSKWPEIYTTKSTTSSSTIAILQTIFARFGNPELLVSDNATQFNSNQFNRFCAENNINRLFSPAWHPQSNGQAERFVDTLKRGLKKLEGQGNPQETLQMFLKGYRSTPNVNVPDAKSPAEAMIGRPLRIELDSLKPKQEDPAIHDHRMESDFNKRHGAKSITFAPGTVVYVKSHKNNHWKWIPGVVISRHGKVCYDVRIDGRIVRVHSNQMRKRNLDAKEHDSSSDTASTLSNPLSPKLPRRTTRIRRPPVRFGHSSS